MVKYYGIRLPKELIGVIQEKAKMRDFLKSLFLVRRVETSEIHKLELGEAVLEDEPETALVIRGELSNITNLKDEIYKPPTSDELDQLEEREGVSSESRDQLEAVFLKKRRQEINRGNLEQMEGYEGLFHDPNKPNSLFLEVDLRLETMRDKTGDTAIYYWILYGAYIEWEMGQGPGATGQANKIAQIDKGQSAKQSKNWIGRNTQWIPDAIRKLRQVDGKGRPTIKEKSFSRKLPPPLATDIQEIVIKINKITYIQFSNQEGRFNPQRLQQLYEILKQQPVIKKTGNEYLFTMQRSDGTRALLINLPKDRMENDFPGTPTFQIDSSHFLILEGVRGKDVSIYVKDYHATVQQYWRPKTLANKSELPPDSPVTIGPETRALPAPSTKGTTDDD